MSFESCINALTQQRDAQGRPAISQDDADLILGRFRDYMMRGWQRAAARAATMRDFDAVGQRKRRQQMLILQKRDEVVKNLTGHTDRHGLVNPIDAAYGHFEGHGYEGFPNVRSIKEAVEGRYFSKIADALHNFRRMTFVSNGSLSGGRKNVAQFGDLRRALHGESASPEMQAFAGQLRDGADYLRKLFNDLAGDTIPKLENWHNPQSHDPHAVHIAGGTKTVNGQAWDPERSRLYWSNYINPMLDWSQMRDPWTGELFGASVPSDEEKMRILGRAWENIVTGGRLSDRPSMAKRGGSMIANSRSDHRFFVFKEANSQGRYAREFGRYGDDILSDFLHYGTGMANDIALMRVLGPNPSAMVEFMKQFIEHEGDSRTVGRPSLLKSVPFLSTESKVGVAKRTIDGFLQQFQGAGVAENSLALSGTVLRNISYSALLGAAQLVHIAVNPVIQLSARYLAGMPMAQMVPHIISSFGKASKKEVLHAGFSLDQAAFTLGEGARQLDRLRHVARWSRWMPDRTTHFSGLSQTLQSLRDTFMRDLSAMMAGLQQKDWHDLPERVQRKMKGYGLTESDWQVIQMADLHEPWKGSAKWLRPEEIAAVGDQRPADVLRLMGQKELFGENGEPYAESEKGRDDARKKTDDLATRFLAFMAGEREEAVPSQSLRAKAIMLGGSSPNTVLGQFVRSAGMFHSFQAAMVVSQVLAFQHEMARNKLRGATWAIAIVLGMTVMSTVAYCLKQVAAGKDVPALDPTTPEGLMTWMHGAALGAIPWLGDYILGTMTDNVRSGGEMLFGPVVGDVMNTVGEVGKLLGNWALPKNHPSRKSSQSRVSEFGVNTLRYSTPVASTLWYLRAAYNRMILDQLQAVIDPDGLRQFRKQEQNLLRGKHQRFWWTPGEVWPGRMPEFSDGPLKGLDYAR